MKAMSQPGQHSKLKAGENISKAVFFMCTAFSILAVGLICFFVLEQSIPALKEIGITNFLFGMNWAPSKDEYGIFPMIVATIYVSIGALIIGAPLGLGCALFLVYYCPKKWESKFSGFVNLLAGIPSIIFGFFALMALVPIMQILSNTSGKGLLTASIVLGIMILPTIISISVSALKAVDPAYYEGSLALGATPERSMIKVVLKAARSGIYSALILGLGRAMGETMAVVMIAGNASVMPSSLFSNIRTMTGNIVLEMSYAQGLHRQALIATALVLLIFILIVNALLYIHKTREEA